MTLRVVDLFAGAGGLSTGLIKAIVSHNSERIAADTGLAQDSVTLHNFRVHVWLAENVDLHAVNHWEPAITTHEENHPWAEHYHSRIEELYPPDVVEPGGVTLLAGGPECTHFSTARGGKPVNDQKRASAWHVLDWIEKLRPEHVLLENVTEFRKWGPIDENGDPTKDGSIFERWIGILEGLGYSVVYDEADEDYGVALNAADYGDPQSRERLFIAASRSKLPTAPPQTHSGDPDDDLPPHRPAADVIDWSDLGASLWTRDLENPRVTPLETNTMARIAEGIRRHCGPRLAPFADVLETIGPDRLEQLREMVVPAEHAAVVADAVDEPFLVHDPGRSSTPSGSYVLGQHSNSVARDVFGRPAPTIATGGKLQVCTTEAFCLRQQSGGVPVSTREPLSTVSSRGAIGMATVDSRPLVKPRNGSRGDLHSNALYEPTERPLHTVTAENHDGHLVTPYLCPLYNERATQRPRTRPVDRPLMTVPKSKSPAAVASPFLVAYYGNSDASPVDEPMPTVTTKDRFALCVPEEWPWGLDVRYRMLQPDELKQAQGFPADYEITGSTKTERTAQIGNAVPVGLAQSLVRHLLADETPSLSNFGGGLRSDPTVEVPDYEEVASDD